MLEKTYRSDAVEAPRYGAWERAGAFAAGARPDAEPYTIMMPPPNVTGSLHMGHGLTFTLQDILIRYRRMRGRDALWQPGTDHAGIATQMVVERQLDGEGLKRADLGREKFVDRVWEWKAESGGQITRQLRSLGASADWARERFTMDEGLSKAVARVFVQLFREGLIYKDQRLVNWDPALETAISDLEVQQTETDGHLWYIRYPVEGREGESLTVATTRPETMLGDTGVAVHPDDPRYRHLVGGHCILPLVGRRIPIVADAHADPEQGSGAVKITPAHDFNDFEVGRRHGLETVNIFDRTAHLNDSVPEAYRGLERFAARERVVADLEAAGVLERVERHRHTVPYGDRGGVPIEPYLTEQWYADAETLAKPAIEAVESGRTRFVPENWAKTYFEWMRNIQPWCISRQLWWGHRIPAWYGPEGSVFVAETEAEARAEAEARFGPGVALERDPDVLDTWFSSALWPFSTLGWPEPVPELDRYYPGDVLVTGFDIIFFWVARMMMMGLHFMGEVPFRTVYIHALVRDQQGAKMSKSKGNIIDPLDMCASYGADALRFTLAALAAPGRDIKLSENRVAGYRNFTTKLWNAARFCEMNGCTPRPGFDPAAVEETLNRWIVARTVETRRQVEAAMEAYRFNEVADVLYRFVWGEFCDWFIEFAKPVFADGGKAAEETRAAAAWVLDRILRMLHPLTPFVTEELNEALGLVEGGLIGAAWPDDEAGEAPAEIGWTIQLISEVRRVRSELNVPAGAKIDAALVGADGETAARAARNAPQILRLARLESLSEGSAPEGSVEVPLPGAAVALKLAEVIDFGKERERLDREMAQIDARISGIDNKLGNERFLTRAPAEVVEDQREQRSELAGRRAALKGALARLG